MKRSSITYLSGRQPSPFMQWYIPPCLVTQPHEQRRFWLLYESRLAADQGITLEYLLVEHMIGDRVPVTLIDFQGFAPHAPHEWSKAVVYDFRKRELRGLNGQEMDSRWHHLIASNMSDLIDLLRKYDPGESKLLEAERHFLEADEQRLY